MKLSKEKKKKLKDGELNRPRVEGNIYYWNATWSMRCPKFIIVASYLIDNRCSQRIAERNGSKRMHTWLLSRNRIGAIPFRGIIRIIRAPKEEARDTLPKNNVK